MRLHQSSIFCTLLAFTAAIVLTGCPGKSPESGSTTSTGSSGEGTASAEVFEGDTSVSADLGGPGFTAAGWSTGDGKPLGDAAAVRGGTMLTNIPNWPENIRVYGTGANTMVNSVLHELCYESLLSLDPRTLDFSPRLATHWQIDENETVFRFRINPKAHWSDGVPVTADDVIATYDLIADETLIDPMSRAAIVDKMERPVAKSKYIVEIRSKERDWRNFITIAGMTILPAHEIGSLAGSEYLEEYNFKFTTVSGPYTLKPEDIKNNESLTFTRRKDYWGENLPENKGLYNFDGIRFVVIRDDRLAFDKACKGELDFYVVYTAKWWVEDTNIEPVQKGHLIKQKVFTQYPQGFSGLAFNVRKPPIDDIRIRKAIAHLYDRKTMIEKFAYNEYAPLATYFPGTPMANPNNQMVEYDPRKAAELLDDAGWTKRGPDGIRSKDGVRLSVTIMYRSKGLEKYYTSLQEDCKKAGLEINLQLLNPETAWKNQQERNFQIASAAWGAVLFPSPRQMWHSSLADAEGSNNITGMKNPEIDALIEQYDKEFDNDKRTEMLRQLDGLLFNEHPYALAWYLPCERIMYWNKFGTPATVFHKHQDWRGAFTNWWVDPQKEKALKAARKSGAPLAPIPPFELHPWDDSAQTAQVIK